MAVTPEQLEEMEQRRLAEEEDSFEDAPDEEEAVEERLRAASDLLKRTAILFEFLSDPDYCRTLTKRYRELMSQQAERAWDLVEELDKETEELEEF